MRRDLPALDRLHERHHGLTEAVCRSYDEAVRVCLSRHHKPPVKILTEADDVERWFTLEWTPATTREHRAWANMNDAVEAGAYGVAIATIEALYGWFAIARAETLTGADYYVGAVGADLESAFRLEISGSDVAGPTELRLRLARKLQQASAGRSVLPALACVVGFKSRLILVSNLENME